MSEIKPATRNEAYWAAMSDDGTAPPKPQTNEECFLAAMSGNYDDELPEPLTRMQGFMKAVVAKGGTVQAAEFATGEPFSPDRNMKIIRVPDGVYAIHDSGFKNYMQLEAVVLPESVGYIGTNAFENCVSLRNINIDNCRIMDSAFSGCVSLETVRLLLKNLVVEQSAFSDCTALKDVDFSGVVSIESKAFADCTALETVILPDTVTGIAADAFTGAGIKYLRISGGMKPGPNTVFAGITTLETVHIPAGVIMLQGSFAGCTNLKNVEIVDTGDVSTGLQAIIDAFTDCTALETITLPSTVQSISPTAFGGCTALTDIYVPWAEGDERNANAPWGAENSTIHYNYTGGTE